MTLSTAPTLFDRFFADFEPSFASHPTVARPPVDLVAYEDRVELLADLPGLSEKDIDVQFEDGKLTIRGDRNLEASAEEAAAETGTGRVLRRERAATRFVRSFALGEEIDVEHIQASMRDGVLRITLPKSERARPRQIQVTVN